MTVQNEATSPVEERQSRRCFLAIPFAPYFAHIRAAVKKAAIRAGFPPVSLEDRRVDARPLPEVLAGELARADCLVADLTGRNPNVFYEIGLAQAMGKTVFLIMEESESSNIPADLRSQPIISYKSTPSGLSELTERLNDSLQQYRRFPQRSRFAPRIHFQAPFFVDWDRLERSEAENLCRELLTQMGFQQLDWWKESPEFDLVAEFPKKDPDGHEYRELWLVSMGRNAPPEMLLEEIAMAAREPDYLVHRLFKGSARGERLFSMRAGDTTITFLIVLLHGGPHAERLEMMREDLEHMSAKRGRLFSYRFRVWDRSYLTFLVQQFPQIGYKYFSDEARAQSKYRKTPEELYQENVSLTEKLASTVAALEDEKNRRVRAERDAVWKDISFSAAHKIGNPIFAIETDLDPLQKRVQDTRTDEAIEVIENMRSAVEKAKAIVDQFKSLTRAQQVTPVDMLLRPVIETACHTAEGQGIECVVECPSDLAVRGDPERFSECLDELVANATHWFDKPEKRIEVLVSQPDSSGLPEAVDSSKRYALVHIRDSGAGVPTENKDRIFDAFFTTHDHGTGLGLSLVRRVVEGHGGVILETGIPGQGADFEIYIPLAGQAEGASPTRAGKPRRQRRPKE